MKPVILDLPSDNNTHYRAVITPGNPVTTCEIQHQAGTIYENHWRLMYHGMSICKHGDRYDMETGCRLALKSALRKPKTWDFAAEKQFRTAAWAAYLAKFPISERVDPAKVEANEYREMVTTFARAIQKSMERDMLFTPGWSAGPFNGKVTWGVDKAKAQS